MRTRAGWLVAFAVMLAACGGGGETGPFGGPQPTATTGATDATGAVSGNNAVAWATETVSLEADHFEILADGEVFLGDADIEVDSDRGDADYTTLELEWEENGVEMNLFMYFEVVDGIWQSDEIRTYDGQENGDWIYYFGPFFASPLGEAFTGTVTLQSETGEERPGKPWNEYTGEIRFVNLRLLPQFQDD
jgi:hypothetical protein